MFRIYGLGLFVLLGISGYLIGMRVGIAQCRADSAIVTQVSQNNMLKQIGEINAKTNNTAVRDIRDCLRQKYTIAE